MKIRLVLILVLLISNIFAGSGNREFSDFIGATKALLKKVYEKGGIDKQTVYCQATFNKDKKIINANGFITDKYLNRKNQMEWEHIVPAKEFGKNIPEWQNKNDIAMCVEKGLDNRTCALRLSKDFKFMLSDLYNIYPSVGALNIYRKDYEFIEGNSEIPILTRMKYYSTVGEKSNLQFGLCPIIIKDKKVIPPNHAKGIIARSYLYMDSTYSVYRLRPSKRNLFKRWSKENPVTLDECTRTKLIEKIQKNQNKIVRKLCKKSKMW